MKTARKPLVTLKTASALAIATLCGLALLGGVPLLAVVAPLNAAVLLYWDLI